MIYLRNLLIIVIGLFLTAISAPNVFASETMPAAVHDLPMSKVPTEAIIENQAYTTNHLFLIKLLSIANPIPFEQYFDLQFAVLDGKNPTQRISDAKVKIFAGMRHGLKHGFAHGMQSSPQVLANGGVYSVSGMYFHMLGEWTLEITVTKNGQEGSAYFQLPCCKQ